MQKKQGVYCIGESLLDIIFKDGKVMAAKPGGALLNTSVSLGLCKVPVELITDFGLDAAGDLIAQFLQSQGVSIRYIDRYQFGKTALALAMLDEDQDASYSFYKDFPTERLNISFPEISTEDMIAYGSIYALSPGIREKIRSFILKGKAIGATILYDPNFRTPHMADLKILKPALLENISMADLVRGSDEDFLNIFGSHHGMEAYSQVKKAGCHRLIYTTRDTVELFTESLHHVFKNKTISPLSTIGAGDGFNAGLLYYLFASGIERKPLDKLEFPDWAAMIGMGVAFAQEICMHYDNYISKEFAAQVIINS